MQFANIKFANRPEKTFPRSLTLANGQICSYFQKNFLEKKIKKNIRKRLVFYMFQENRFPFVALNKYRTKQNNKFPAQAFVGIVNLKKPEGKALVFGKVQYYHKLHFS